MRASGILLPVSALPSQYGIGSFSKEAYEFVNQLKGEDSITGRFCLWVPQDTEIPRTSPFLLMQAIHIILTWKRWQKKDCLPKRNVRPVILGVMLLMWIMRKFITEDLIFYGKPLEDLNRGRFCAVCKRECFLAGRLQSLYGCEKQFERGELE